MPSKAPLITEATQAQLLALGEQIRTHRKTLRVSATVAAEAAGLSRVTLHRIENGAISVTMGAWANVMSALSMTIQAQPTNSARPQETPTDLSQWIPARVSFADYPQLQSLAWQVQGVDSLRPSEAHDIYERNARHIDQTTLSDLEASLITALRTAFGTENV